MHISGQLVQGFRFGHLLRAHYGKAIIFCLVLFFFLEYASKNIFYRSSNNNFVVPGFSWISSFNQNSSEEIIPTFQEKISKPFNKHNFSSMKNNLRVIKTVADNILPASKINNLPLNKTSQETSIKECPLVPPNLVGRLKVLTEPIKFEELEAKFHNVHPGGRFWPPDCKARYRVALVIPYRDREEHLRRFLNNLHPLLQRQQLDYGIYVIEEAPVVKFNRALLMNIGYVEALKQYDYDCFIFHDVDLIPEDDRNFYTCPEQPRHMSVAINTMNYRLPYKDIFGGVSALTKKHMQTVNGFSNEFWGWGGEDDDMSNRIRYHGLKISRYSEKIARYTMLKHKKDDPNPDRYNKLYKGKYRYKKDGLNNLNYTRLDLVFKKLFTWVLVDIESMKKK